MTAQTTQPASLPWLEKLIAIPTVSGTSNLELIELIEAEFSRYGYSGVRTYNEDGTRANLLVTVPAADGTTGDGHDVRVAGENNTAAGGAVRCGDGDEEVSAGAVLVVGAHAAVAVAAEFGFEKLDEFQVGAAGDGGDRDKLFEPGEGRRLSGLCGHEEPFCCAFVPGVATFRVRRGAVFVAWSPPNTAP